MSDLFIHGRTGDAIADGYGSPFFSYEADVEQDHEIAMTFKMRRMNKAHMGFSSEAPL